MNFQEWLAKYKSDPEWEDSSPIDDMQAAWNAARAELLKDIMAMILLEQ